MTSGSGNGWPDVIKVPAQKVDHNPLCPMSAPNDGKSWAHCQCDLIAKVRAAEREHTAFLHEALLRNQLADLRAGVESLREAEQRAYAEERETVHTLNNIKVFDRVLDLFDGGSDD